MDLKKLVESLNYEERVKLLKILANSKMERITVRDWVKNNHDLSSRAKNTLLFSAFSDSYMDEITITDLKKIRNLGDKTLREICSFYKFEEK